MDFELASDMEPRGDQPKAIEETERRRALQKAFNKTHGITPKTIIKKGAAPIVERIQEVDIPEEAYESLDDLLIELETQMRLAAERRSSSERRF